MQAVRGVSWLVQARLAIKLTVQFLERDPNKRLGYRPGGGGFEDIKSHPWFKGINWNALHNKEVVPPFEPDVSSSTESFRERTRI